MSDPRWKLKQATVTEGDNSVVVRQLTTAERREFIELGKNADVKPLEKTTKIVEWCTVPKLSREDIDAMPPELHDAAVEKVMELSGLKMTDAEKKEMATLPTAH